MVLNGIIQAYRTQIHLTLQGVYAAELGPCEWLIECSYHWKARVYRFSLLYSPLVLLSMTTHTILPINEKGNKRNPAGSRWWKKLWNLTGQNKTHCRSVDQIVVLPCGPLAAYNSPTAATAGRIQMYIYHPFICNSCTAHKNLMGCIFSVTLYIKNKIK